jgi:hypothetical protein
LLPRYKQRVGKLKSELSAIPLAPAPAEEVSAVPSPAQDFHD